jgi:fluoroquinolone transport system ATP-binding protein
MLSVESLSYRYPNSQQDTLRRLTFTIARGEIFGFLGPSGSGKSTTQKILYKLLSGYQGDIRFEGKPLQQWDRSFYERIGVSFELPNHYLKLTAEENLRFFASFYQSNIRSIPELLALVGLADDADKRVSEFSKGMKMRLNFIRALLHNPDVLFLDEPTSGLDPLNARVIKNIILDLKAAGKTIFLTTHNMFDADQVALLHDGEIKNLDTPLALKLRYGSPKVKVTQKEQPGQLVFDLDRLGQNEAFLRLLQADQIQTIHSEEATLEDAFIKVTGERLFSQ